MDKFKTMQDIIINSIYVNDNISILLKAELLSFLFFHLCWDFDYYKLIGELEK